MPLTFRQMVDIINAGDVDQLKRFIDENNTRLPEDTGIFGTSLHNAEKKGEVCPSRCSSKNCSWATEVFHGRPGVSYTQIRVGLQKSGRCSSSSASSFLSLQPDTFPA